MHNEKVISKAIEEIKNRTFGTTEQILEVHDVAMQDGIPTALRVDAESQESCSTVYFAIKDEKFFLAIGVRTFPELEITDVYTEAAYHISFSLSSPSASFKELSSLVALTPTGGWSKGDGRAYNPQSKHKNTHVIYEPDPGPGEFEEKLNKLLHYLEQDAENVKHAAEIANGYIQVAAIYHNGNTMLGGPTISASAIKRMAALNLPINFDNYAEGKFYIS